jgi:hypothetical protein
MKRVDSTIKEYRCGSLKREGPNLHLHYKDQRPELMIHAQRSFSLLAIVVVCVGRASPFADFFWPCLSRCWLLLGDD